ncbi:hypothetical protein C8Q75DRAFT_716562 [Abortiporus biennis]|nr:hypothetical protein C8Q75DRAFT_716562 [Abortiporus biennis]
MVGTKVIIIGGGIAGPILSLFLKQKGFEPIIYERQESVTDAGLGLGLQPNGLIILDKIHGLLESLEGCAIERFLMFSEVPEDAGILADSDAPSKMKEKFGHSILSVKRTTFHRQLVEAAQKAGVEVVFGHRLVSLKQDDNSVTVTFANGNTATASFVVGCDGLHSDTRISLFGKEEPSYTGLAQCGGISSTPDILRGQKTMMNVFGNGVHFIAAVCNDTETFWASTRREPESKETWRSMDQEAQEKFKQETVIRNWGNGVGELVSTATKIVKYGLYDRPELSTWHKGRVVLIGDAAHPTSPHLGQGANQAFEDINLLTELLKQNAPGSGEYSTESLEKIFTDFEKQRIPRCAQLVKEARRLGDQRVLVGVEACKERNNEMRMKFGTKDNEAMAFKLYERTLDLKKNTPSESK